MSPYFLPCLLLVASTFPNICEAQKRVSKQPKVLAAQTQKVRLQRTARSRRAIHFLHSPALQKRTIGKSSVGKMLHKRISKVLGANNKQHTTRAMRLLRKLGHDNLSTLQHCTRVGNNTQAVAELMGVDGEQAWLAGTFHDLGKLRTPNEILDSPRQLSPEERITIDEHTQNGVNLLRAISQAEPMMMPAVVGAKFHHERWDGKGHNKLAGNKIPLIARIIAVVDTYDAIVSKRSYSEGKPPALAFRILRENSGTQFDPAVVRVFTKWMQRQDHSIALVAKTR